MIMVFYFRDRPSDIGVLEYGSRPGDEPISTSLPPIVLLNEFLLSQKHADNPE